ncbi:MAG: hypothetical protein NTZ37_02065 [Methanoregula sp.]|nr:hypothetical protein [Methanoregula sp.]
MQGEKLSDAIAYKKLNLLKKDFFGYIERNSAKVDANLPVFFGHVISTLENSFPTISDQTYDEFIDSVTFKLLDTSTNIRDFEYIKKVILNVLRLKRRKNADIGINIVVGLKLLKSGDFAHALDFLKKYSNLDAKIGTAVAYCYYVLSLQEFFREDNREEAKRNQRPGGEMELLSRETMLSLARENPPVNSLKQLDIDDPAYLEKIFWQMVFLGFEWFPSERWFIEIGLKNAIHSHNTEMRMRLLDISAVRFETDFGFQKEMYFFKLESRDAAGAAGVVSQLIRQYPDDPEPVYFGLKLSLLTTKKTSYQAFKKLAKAKGMPDSIIELCDIAFDLMEKDNSSAMNRIAEFERQCPHALYYGIAIRYIAADFFSDNETRVKRAKKALIDSIDHFCTEEIKKKKM